MRIVPVIAFVVAVMVGVPVSAAADPPGNRAGGIDDGWYTPPTKKPKRAERSSPFDKPNEKTVPPPAYDYSWDGPSTSGSNPGGTRNVPAAPSKKK